MIFQEKFGYTSWTRNQKCFRSPRSENYGGKSDGADDESLEVRQWRRVYLQRIQRLLSKGIKHQLSIPGQPEQNKVAERMNQTLTERARSINLQADMSEGFCVEAVNHASHLVNMSPLISNDLQIPEEIWRGEWLVSKTAYFIPHLHIYLILNSTNNTSLVCFYVHGVQWRRRP